jgi:hypothetical protein
MAESKTRSIKYICLDIVGYTYKRSVEAQLDIREVLDEIIKNSISENQIPQDKETVKYLPTGDGMCIALLGIDDPLDIHLLVALSIIKGVSAYNGKAEDEELKFQARIGINAHTDNIVTDINGNENIAGVGINTAFRIMDMADGMQILVSQSVFEQLRHSKKYRDSFNSFHAIVKHGTPLPLHQFTGDGDGLQKSTPQTIKDYYDFLEPASALGLKHIYKSRDEVVERDVIKDIDNAKTRVWLLGVGLYNNIRITGPEFAQKLNSKINDGVQVRILLLDGLRRSAVFRTLLESSREEFRQIIGTKRRDPENPPVNDPYFRHELFRNFRNAYEVLGQFPNFRNAVRFYIPTPSCWLAIVDDKAYFQPYTFGDISDDPKNHAIGYQMPVIKLQGQTKPIGILEDHFKKLWLTSNTDLFQTGGQIVAKEIMIWEVFKDRLKWFEDVYGVLYNEDSPGEDRRSFPRRPCISKGLVTKVTWEDDVATHAEILNFSRDSVFLALALDVDSKRFASLTEEGEMIVRLDITSKQERRSAKTGLRQDKLASRYLVDELLIPNDYKFKYVRKEVRKVKDEERPCVALRAHKE